MAGNKAVRDGKFVTEEQQPKNESKINTETQKEDQGIPLLHIISGIIIIIIILFLVFRLKASGQGGGS
jgi:Fe2+ transport system protein B